MMDAARRDNDVNARGGPRRSSLALELSQLRLLEIISLNCRERARGSREREREGFCPGICLARAARESPGNLISPGRVESLRGNNNIEVREREDCLSAERERERGRFVVGVDAIIEDEV